MDTACREYPVLTLTHSLARTRAAWGITNRPGAILRRCMRARGIAHLLAAVCRIFARSAQNLAPAARAYKSKAIGSMRRPIGKLRPGRCRPATQLRRQQLVQNSPARPTRLRLEREKPRRWIIIIYVVLFWYIKLSTSTGSQSGAKEASERHKGIR